jgi:hypothetical protein
MDGCSTPQRRHRWFRGQRAALLGALLFAGACNFSIAGFADSSDGGKTPPGQNPPGMDPQGNNPPGMNPQDAGVPPDLAITPAPDLSSPPDLSPLPDKVGDACAGNCGGGLTCMNWVPAGYCSETCDGSANSCPTGSTCAAGSDGTHYCLVNANGGGNCMRQDVSCRDCSTKVCGPSNFCDGC